MSIDLNIDEAVDASRVPVIEQLSAAVAAAALVTDVSEAFEVALSVVGPDQMAALNQQWREKPKPTNVLAFANQDVEGWVAPPNVVRHLGDIVICASVVADEADAQSKRELDHWRHLVVHGTLHLMGYDHIESAEAEIMEQLERDALATLGISDPYA
ncbi:MAG: rRNA maturation RNase YbeY [Pseudomonadota bacterium]